MSSDRITSGRNRYAVLQLAKRFYAIPIESIREILPMAEVSQPPCAPPFLRGFLDLGGQLLAVVSLRRLWELPDREPQLYTPLVVLKSTTQAVALEVDAVSRIVAVDQQDALPIEGGGSFNDCATAVARIDRQTVLLVSPERILMEQEQRRLEELAEAERRRLSALAGGVA